MTILMIIIMTMLMVIVIVMIMLMVIVIVMIMLMVNSDGNVDGNSDSDDNDDGCGGVGYHYRYTLCSLFTYSFDTLLTLMPFPAEFGNFTFLMDMYRTDEYKDVVDSYPHPVRLGDDMFFKVRVISKDSKLVLFIKNAKATPTSDFDDGTDYQFIEDG